MEEGAAAGGASGFETGCRNSANAGGTGDIRSEMILICERGAVEITEVKSFYIGGSATSVFEAGSNRFDGKILETAVGEGPKGCLADSRCMDRSHIIQS